MSLIRMEVIKKPLITKKTSTPMKPPLNPLGKAWKKTTDKTGKLQLTTLYKELCVLGAYFFTINHDIA